MVFLPRSDLTLIPTVVAPTGARQYSSAVQKKAHRTIEKPAYLLESVDNALRLLQMLRDVGALRLKDAAEELDIAPSTAHRLLAMLVYRGFAVQDEKRRYHPGPAMGAGPAQRGWTREFTDTCRPHLEALALACGETVHLEIRVGTQVRFLTSAESNATLRVGDRQGQVLPAELTSGGRALLAELPDDALAALYPAEQLAALHKELAGIRAAGFALNVEQTEEGVAAFAVAVHNRAGRAIAAVSVAVPAVRYRRHAEGDLIPTLKRAVRELELDIADIDPN
jgi:DNA-binding IclR family transcriptional regulator